MGLIRWQNNKDILWYSRNKDGQGNSIMQSAEDELAEIKRIEEEAMAEAL